MKKYTMHVANDPGNSEHDIIIDGTLYRSPSVIVKNNWNSLERMNQRNFVEDLENNIHATIVSKNSENCNYYVGNSALNSRKPLKNIDVSVLNAKYNSEIPFVSTNALIATHTVKKMIAEGVEDKTAVAEVKMVVGIPAAQFTIENSKIYSTKFTNDEPMVSIHTPEKVFEIKIKYKFVLTLSEGAEVLRFLSGCINIKGVHDKLFKEYEKHYKKRFNGKFNESITLSSSVGEGTTEHMFSIKGEIDYRNASTAGAHLGLGRAIDRMLPQLKMERKLSKFARQDVSIAIRDVGSKNHEASLRLLEKELETEADDIFNLLVQDVSSMNNEVDFLVVYGGGSILLKKHLYKKLVDFGKLAGLEVIYIDEDYSQILEVMGFQAFMNSKEFKAIERSRRAS